MEGNPMHMPVLRGVNLVLSGCAVALMAVAVLTLGSAPAGASPYAPDGDLAVSTVSPVPGGTITVAGDGFAADSQVRVVIFSEPVVLGTTTADASGQAELSVQIPSSFAPGSTHTLEMQGVDPSGDVRVLSQTITLDAAGGDSGDDTFGLAYTGLAGPGLALLAGGLLLGGTALVLLARRRAAARG
jgi:hypothetical protein